MLQYTHSNVFVSFVFNSGLVLLLAGFLMMVFIVIFRVWSVQRQREIARFSEDWGMIFTNIDKQIPADFPSVDKNKEFYLLQLWSDAFESATHSAQKNLRKIASQLQFSKNVSRMLDHSNGNYQILAIRTAGYLKDEVLNPKLHNLLDHPSPLLSLMAARALIQIKPRESLDALIPYFLSREEWMMDKILYILKDIDSDILCHAIEKSLQNNQTKNSHKLVRLLVLADADKGCFDAKKILRSYQEPQVIAAALQLINKREDKRLLVPYTRHVSWQVRLAALKSLAEQFTANDIDIIALLLSDNEWEVRHLMAEILVDQAFADTRFLTALEYSLVDLNAKEALNEAKSKRGI